MNRKGSPEEIRALIGRARSRGITLRTTMIVGFPGETEDDFRRLLDFVAEMRFDRLGAFVYSAEEGTPAAQMEDQVPQEVAQERLDRLMTLQQGISLSLNRARVGSVCEALLEGRDESGRWLARTRQEAPEGDGRVILTPDASHRAGEFVKARITGADTYDLTGEIL